MNTKTIISWIVGVVAFIALVYGLNVLSNPGPNKLDGFAQCLKDKGAQFFGAFWCPHCQAQKALFGSAKQYLPYIECSTPDGNGQLPVCTDKGVKSYPTWFFADSSRKDGEMTLTELSEKTKCELPVEDKK